ncbi:hypothetical protein CDIK_2383 [Cucumispora dikerogammari]|nr:hypothetical protein CDIK_2383 [Cucumispora dikerogammari]
MFKFKKPKTKSEQAKRGLKKKSTLTEVIYNKIEKIVSKNPQYTLKKTRNKLIASELKGFSISLSSIARFLTTQLITLKKARRELDRVNDPQIILGRKEYAFSSTRTIVMFTLVSFSLMKLCSIYSLVEQSTCHGSEQKST